MQPPRSSRPSGVMTPSARSSSRSSLVLRDHLEERAVRVPDLQRPYEVGVRDPALDEVRVCVLPLAEGLVVVLDDTGEDLAGPRSWRRAMEGRALGRGLRLVVAERRQRLDRRPARRSRPLLHQPLEVEPRTSRQRLERPAEAHLVALRDETDDVARGPAPEAVVEPLRRRDVEARRLLLVKRARCDELLALLLAARPRAQRRPPRGRSRT